MTSSSGCGRQAPGLGLIVLALTPFACGYFLSYLYRAMNAVVAPDLVRDIGLSASELGLLTAAYLFAFSLFQLPLGILLDRFGPRRVQSALVAIGGCGALLFAFAGNALELTIARAIIGLGFAGGLMSSFKAVVLWVSEPRRALANALVMSIGAVGLMVATAPTELAINAYGWRHVFTGLGIFTLAVAALIFLAVPERGGLPAPASLSHQIGDVGRIFRDRVFLAMAPLLALTAGNHIALQTLWVGPWLRDVAGLERGQVADNLFVIAGAFLVGVLASGAVADRLVRRGASLLDVMLGFLAVYFLAQIVLILEIKPLGLAAWCLFCMTGGVAILAYPWLSSHFGAGLSGRSNTAINLLMFLSAFAIQYAVGIVIDLYPRTAGGGYQPAAYRAAFMALLALQLVAFAWYLANRRLLQRTEAQRLRPWT